MSELSTAAPPSPRRLSFVLAIDPANLWRSKGLRQALSPNPTGIRGALALVLCVPLLLAATGCGDDDAGEPEPTGPRAATAEDLRELAGSVDHPVYWVGPQADTQYELTVTDEGQIYIRYLDPGVPIGSEQAEALTVSTYPTENADDVLKDSTQNAEASTATAPGDGIVVVYASDPRSAYLAYPGADHQVEIFAPKPAAARAIATSERIRPLE